MSKKLQMKFWSTWKLKIFLFHFQKVKDHEHLMNGWRIMAKGSQSALGSSTWHNFCYKAPNWSTLFALCLSWPIFSQSNIALHEINSHDHLSMHVYFGGKMHNSNLVDHMSLIPIPCCSLDDFEWLWSLHVHCSRAYRSCHLTFAFLAIHLISHYVSISQA